MPIKAHVKGKRKAPPPPPPQPPSNGKRDATIINQCENAIPNGKTGKTPEPMACDTIQKRKKAAPFPPAASNTAHVNKEKHAIGNEIMNNLSAKSKKDSDKSAVNAINLNIFEPNNIHFQCTAKETNEINVNLDSKRRHNQQRNNQVWICNNCTLQNPFWKIVCEACEKIKPYDTPTISNVNVTTFVTNVDNDSERVNENNLMSTVVMMRPKPIKSNNDVDKILERNSMNIDIKSGLSSTAMPNKRNSLFVFKYGDQNNITTEALEMEKERIRSLIRAMKSRAMAQKYPKKLENQNDDINNEFVTKTATIKRSGKKQNNLLKYDIKNDYNLPSVRKNCSTRALNEFKEIPCEITSIGKIEKKSENIFKCNERVDNKQAYCDEISLMNIRKSLKHITNGKHHNESNTNTIGKSLKSNIENGDIL